jgi:hypothetical protein
VCIQTCFETDILIGTQYKRGNPVQLGLSREEAGKATKLCGRVGCSGCRQDHIDARASETFKVQFTARSSATHWVRSSELRA